MGVVTSFTGVFQTASDLEKVLELVAELVAMFVNP